MLIHQNQRKNNASRKPQAASRKPHAATLTDARVHDSQLFEDFIDEGNSGHSVWAKAAYRSVACAEKLRASGCKSHIH